MKTLLEVLQSGTDYLARQGCDEARATMQHLMAHVLHCNRTALYSRFDRPVEEAELAPLRELLKRRAAGEPLQHLLGFTEFFRRDFLTDARALIPRPETEELVEMVLKKIPDRPVRVLDMGTGSGIIGVTLALELKERAKEVVLADISPQALDLALENAMRLGARVSTVQTDLFENIPLEKPVLRQEGADSSASVPEEYPGRINEGKTVCPAKRQLTRFQSASAIHVKHTSLNALILIIAIPIERIIIIRIPIRNDIQ